MIIIMIKIIIYIIKLAAHIYIFVCIYIYMSAKAGQTAVPNGLKFFERTLEYLGGNNG